MSVSVIIPVLNGATVLDEQLAALHDQDYAGDWEVLVVDNGSTDESIDVAMRWTPLLPIAVISCAQRGLNHARNEGIAHSHGDRLLFCDCDDEVAPGWISAMESALRHHALVGGRLDYEKLNSDDVLSAVDVRYAQTDLPYYRGARHAIGCNMGMRRDVFATVGEFDGDLIAGADEMDFFYRAHRSGIDAVFVPDAVVSYRLRPSLPSAARQAYRNALAHAQLDKKLRAASWIPPQTRRSRLAALWSHTRSLAHVELLFSHRGRWRYAQRAANAVGALVAYFRFGQLVI